MTAEEIQNLKVGDLVETTIDCRNARALPGARYTKPARVTSIFARGVSVKGDAYVCGYRELGDRAEMSFSVSAGEEYVRIFREERHALPPL